MAMAESEGANACLVQLAEAYMQDAALQAWVALAQLARHTQLVAGESSDRLSFKLLGRIVLAWRARRGGTSCGVEGFVLLVACSFLRQRSSDTFGRTR